jgi:type IV pilus assembly protein PilW
MGIAVKIFLVQQKAYNVQGQLSEMQQNIRAATDMIVRETKMAGYNPTGTAFSSGIIYATDTLRILADLDGDGAATGTNEDITYSYDAGNFQIDRDIGGGGQPLAENIQAFDFSYLDANGDPVTNPINEPDIRQIKIRITGRTTKVDSDLKRVDGVGYRYGTLTTRVTPENLNF